MNIRLLLPGTPPVAMLVAMLSVLLLPVSDIAAQAIPESQKQNPWFVAAQTTVNAKLAETANNASSAKNVILFVGDGMGISTLTAARIFQGQSEGGNGEESALSFELFPYTALAKTYNVNAQIADSAGTMTAMVSGVKTHAGMVGVDENAVRGFCASQIGNEVASALELAEIKGMATGIITTARVTHATPAAAYAKVADRNWEDISDMPEQAVQDGCEDIASQLINFESNLEARYPNADVDGIDLVLGGGRRHFLPEQASDQNITEFGQASGDRTDGLNLIRQWQSDYPDGQYVFSEVDFDAIDASSTPRLMGLFADSHLRYEADRRANSGQQPSLSSMVRKGIDILDNNANGFLLIVESGRIDHSHHAGNAYNALSDTVELARSVVTARQGSNDEETLILVTADHSHVMSISGFAKRGNPILGKIVPVGHDVYSVDENGLPYTSINYANGRGFRDFGNNTDPDLTYTMEGTSGRQDLSSVNTQAPGFHQEALIPLDAETHGGEDVAVHAVGPGAHLVQGVVEQNLIFHYIDKALGLTTP